MAEQKKRTTRKSTKSTARRKSTAAKSKAKAKTAPKKKSAPRKKAAASSKSSTPLDNPLGSLFDGITELTSGAIKLASEASEQAAKTTKMVTGGAWLEKTKSMSPERMRMMAAAGESLRDMREVTGMTVAEITEALDLRDKSFLEAVEDGRETLSLEMILRLASLYARNDPVPFVMQQIRTYSPRLWDILEDWGLDSLPLNVERERRFINIYRRRDAARELSPEGFDKVLAFTQQAFELSLHFIAELEEIENEVNPDYDD